jgi:hypothetical protein
MKRLYWSLVVLAIAALFRFFPRGYWEIGWRVSPSFDRGIPLKKVTFTSAMVVFAIFMIIEIVQRFRTGTWQ